MSAAGASGGDVNVVSRLDNAGSLHQSVTSDLKNSKISIVSAPLTAQWCRSSKDKVDGSAL
jgi:hypothetical protein